MLAMRMIASDIKTRHLTDNNIKREAAAAAAWKTMSMVVGVTQNGSLPLLFVVGFRKKT
jgi:hypothetical protein